MKGEDGKGGDGDNVDGEGGDPDAQQRQIDREVSLTGEALRSAVARQRQRHEKARRREEEGRPAPSGPEAAAPVNSSSPVDGPTPAQWEELRAWSGDSLAAARAILKDAGSVTRWSRVLIEKARTLQQGRVRHGGWGVTDTGTGDRALVVRMEGDVDLIASPHLRSLLLELAGDEAATSGSRTVVVDLEAVRLLDMSGCTALIDGQRALAERGLGLAVLLRPGSQPERTFLALSLGTVLRRVLSLDDI